MDGGNNEIGDIAARPKKVVGGRWEEAARPTKSHLKEVNRVVRYLNRTINKGLWYPKDTGFELIGFSDGDQKGFLVQERTRLVELSFLVKCWSSKKIAQLYQQSRSTIILNRVKKIHSKGLTSVSEPKDGSDKFDAELDEGMEYMDTEEVVNEGRQSTVDTARPDVDTARPDVSTARQELNTLIKLKDDKANGVTFKDSESTDRPARSILTLKPLPIIDPKDKGKGVLEEPESAKKMTKSDFDVAQIARDEKIAK
nr:uncharacterized mitochondrial protein AtMg00810-like [Tanacetum cinerariifolium]